MTTLITPPSITDVGDSAVIDELHRLFDVQGAAFLADPYPDIDAPRRRLVAWPA